MSESGQAAYAMALDQFRRGSLRRADEFCTQANFQLEGKLDVVSPRSLALVRPDPVTGEMQPVSWIDARRLTCKIRSTMGNNRDAADSLYFLREQVMRAGEMIDQMNQEKQLRWADLTLDWVNYESGRDDPRGGLFEALERARQVYEIYSDLQGVAWSHFIEGCVHWRQGCATEAFICYEVALPVILSEQMDPAMTLEFLVQYIYCLGRNGFHKTARLYLAQGVELARKHGSQYQINRMKLSVQLSTFPVVNRLITPAIYAVKMYRLLASFDIPTMLLNLRSYLRNSAA